MLKFSVTQNGKELDPSLYDWDENFKTFSTNENNLVLDFSRIDAVTFKTGSNCNFITGSNCNFKTGNYCIFRTRKSCNFITGIACTFKTGSNCNFITGNSCTFKTYASCTFKTGSHCNFIAGNSCNFKTYDSCTFNVDSNDCIFHTGESCVVIRRDKFEVTYLEENKTTKLSIEGFTYVKEHVITIDGKDIKLSEESYKELKKQLN